MQKTPDLVNIRRTLYHYIPCCHAVLCRLTALYWSDLGRECVFDAAAFLACGLGVGRWQQGWWRTACCVSILFVCIHLGDAAAFVPKNSLCPPARPFLPSDLYLPFLRFVPLRPGLLLCLSVLSFVPPHPHVTPVISFPVHPSWPLQCKRSSGFSYLQRYPGWSHGQVVPPAHQWRLKVKIWKLFFFPHFESLSIFHFCW